MNSPDILDVRGLTHTYGGVAAVDGCDLRVKRGSVTALIGPNGAGKTTLLNVVSGGEALQAGTIVFDGVNISGWPSYRIARRGLLRTYQLSREFSDLTVIDNLLVVAQSVGYEHPWSALFSRKAARRMETSLLHRIAKALDDVGLTAMGNRYATELSGGQKRLLELARVMVAEPRLVILDEPMAGVNPVLIESVARAIQHWRSTRGISFLIIEHKLDVVEALCDEVIVMVNGKSIASGTMHQLRQDEAVVHAFLGERTVYEAKPHNKDDSDAGNP